VTIHLLHGEKKETHPELPAFSRYTIAHAIIIWE
jgi:hypothetical protein